MLLHWDIYKNYTNALVLWTGGGNDIVSALIIALDLQKNGVNVSLAGMNSPAAVHMYNGRYEEPINKLGDNTRRFVTGKWYPTSEDTPWIEISCIDGHLPETLRKHGIDIPHIYNFSTRYGTHELQRWFEALIEEMKYDLIVAVDVGGDILARWAADNTILSPHMDFTSLHLLKQLKTPSLLVEFWIGTDGELRPDGMKAILDEVINNNMLLHTSDISNEHHTIDTFRKIFWDLKTIRAGNTAVNTLKTLDQIEQGSNDDLKLDYRFRTRIEKQTWDTWFEVVLPREHFGKVYSIDSQKFAAARSHTAFAFENSLEQYIKLKLMQPNWKTELDAYYLWSEGNWTTPEREWVCMHCLLLSDMIPLEQRTEILRAAQKHLHEGKSDCMLIRSADLAHLIDQPSDKVQAIWPFTLVYGNLLDAEHVGEIYTDIQRYTKKALG